MSPADFKAGEQVLYVPNHAHGDTEHPDCERGIVSSTNEVNVFVRYYNKRGELAQTAQATSPEDLRSWPRLPPAPRAQAPAVRSRDLPWYGDGE